MEQMTICKDKKVVFKLQGKPKIYVKGQYDLTNPVLLEKTINLTDYKLTYLKHLEVEKLVTNPGHITISLLEETDITFGEDYFTKAKSISLFSDYIAISCKSVKKAETEEMEEIIPSNDENLKELISQNKTKNDKVIQLEKDLYQHQILSDQLKEKIDSLEKKKNEKEEEYSNDLLKLESLKQQLKSQKYKNDLKLEIKEAENQLISLNNQFVLDEQTLTMMVDENFYQGETIDELIQQTKKDLKKLEERIKEVVIFKENYNKKVDVAIKTADGTIDVNQHQFVSEVDNGNSEAATEEN